jgi:hypothetical protein
MTAEPIDDSHPHDDPDYGTICDDWIVGGCSWCGRSRLVVTVIDNSGGRMVCDDCYEAHYAPRRRAVLRRSGGQR